VALNDSYCRWVILKGNVTAIKMQRYMEGYVLYIETHRLKMIRSMKYWIWFSDM